MKTRFKIAVAVMAGAMLLAATPSFACSPSNEAEVKECKASCNANAQSYGKCKENCNIWYRNCLRQMGKLGGSPEQPSQ